VRARPTQRTVIVAASTVALLALGVVLVGTLSPFKPRAYQNLPLNELARRVVAHDIIEIEASDTGGTAKTQSGQVFTLQKENGAPILHVLANLGVTSRDLATVTFSVAEGPPTWIGLVLSFGPLLLFAGVLLFALRRLSSGNVNPMQSFGKSRARLNQPEQREITFSDVAGVEEAQQELQEIVEFLKEPQKFTSLGARIPRGVLLVGPPGTGKTLLARAVAGEGGVPFFSISGSEFVEMFVGVGASRVRDLFQKANKSAPCIVFVDEIDAVGRQRGSGLGSANDEREQTLNQILVEMDGFDDHVGLIVIAATNRPDVLDPALLRPGRFDRVVVVPAPDVRGRLAILEVHARGKPLHSDVGLKTLASQTPGFSGADLANVLNEGAILAARRNKKTVSMSELEEAIDRVSAGPERRSHVMSDAERQVTAYQEGGHAVVAKFLANHDPVHKMTIIPRGLRGGYTRFLPPEDRSYMSRTQYLDAVTATLGGHAAEAVVFGEMSTGAGDDIQRATTIVRNMVKIYGMSERLGPVAFGRKHQMIFLGRDIGEQRNYSDHVGEMIDDEIHRLIDEAYARARSILQQHRDVLDTLARALLGSETLDASAIEHIFQTAGVA
jgi:cell division protease FtsH